MLPLSPRSTLSLHDALPIWLVAFLLFLNPQCLASISRWITASSSWKPSIGDRSEERFSRNAETDIVCRLLLEKKKIGSLKSRVYRTCCDQCTGRSSNPSLHV